MDLCSWLLEGGMEGGQLNGRAQPHALGGHIQAMDTSTQVMEATQSIDGRQIKSQILHKWLKFRSVYCWCCGLMTLLLIELWFFCRFVKLGI